jgi:hypothetical protein
MSEIKPPPPPFALRESDKVSDTWRVLRRHLEDRLQHWRVQNEGDLDAVRTAHNRGRIAVLKELIALDQNPPPGGTP